MLIYLHSILRRLLDTIRRFQLRKMSIEKAKANSDSRNSTELSRVDLFKYIFSEIFPKLQLIIHIVWLSQGLHVVWKKI